MTLSPLVFATLIFALVVSISYAVLVRWLPDPGKERLAQLTPGRGSDHSTLWSRLQKRLLAWLLVVVLGWWLGQRSKAHPDPELNPDDAR